MPTLRTNEKSSLGRTHGGMKDTQYYQSGNYANNTGGNRNLTLKQLKDTIE